MKVSEKKEDQFYLSKNGQDVGPYTATVILEKIKSGEHQWTDYVFDPTGRDWVVLLDHPLFSPVFNDQFKKPQPPPMAATPAKTKEELMKEKQWYVLKDSKNIGPFSKIEIVQMLQLKSLFEYDHIWSKDFPAWKRISEVAEFSYEEIREMKAHVEMKDIFFRRKHERTEYGCHITLHNNTHIFKGKSIELSEGGAGIILENPQFLPGDVLYLHFQPGEDVPPFNAICNIVSKTILPGEGKVKYGTKFVHLSPKIQNSIRQFAKNQKQRKKQEQKDKKAA